MTAPSYTPTVLDTLLLARRVANYAQSAGFSRVSRQPRPRSYHLGALLADSVLQSGLNYRTVVKPRVERIIRLFPESATLTGTMTVVERATVSYFLMWQHADKLERFTRLCNLLHMHRIEDVSELQLWLRQTSCRDELLQIRGIGPKTVDYLACLAGIDNVAVDRHVRGFARRAGIEVNDYDVLKTVFCCAADLLGASRRDFDAWIWAAQRTHASRQYELFESSY